MYEKSIFDDKKGILSIVAAFAIGSLIGASVALLMAPQSGMAMRSRIADNASDLKDKATGAMEDSKERAGKAVEGISKKSKEKVAELRGKGQEQLEEQVKTAKKAMGY